jgi:hypothetical protein
MIDRRALPTMAIGSFAQLSEEAFLSDFAGGVEPADGS